MNAPPRTIVIVGAGFCGTTLAVNLLRMARGQTLRVILIERAQFARGLAYSRQKYPYLLNVPAGRMSASPDDPGEFLAFAQRSRPDAGASDFLLRELYGEYLESLLRNAENHAPGTSLQRLVGAAVAIEPAHRHPGFHVHLADGRSVHADELVLATGNPGPAALPGDEKLRGAANYVGDPWKVPPRFRAGESVLIVGTGLTMADVVMAGTPPQGQRVQIHALSRRGLVPAAQTPFLAGDPSVRLELLSRAHEVPGSVVHLSRTARRLARELVDSGDDWRKVVTGIREAAPELWQRLPAPARRRFVTHLRPYWDVHRHRIPESTAAALRGLQQAGELAVHAGRIIGFTPAGKLIEVRYRPRGQRAAAALLVHRVINCTGPNYDVSQTQERVLRGLLAQGVATADPLHLGLATDSLGRLIGANGNTTRHLYYLGPLLRARDWESTAASELRLHAVRLARHLSVARSEDFGRIAVSQATRAGAAVAPIPASIVERQAAD